MKFNRRIVPFTTVFLVNDADFNRFVAEAVEWCSSDSFNPAGRAFVVNVQTHTISIINRLREKKVKPKREFSKLSLIYFILKVKPSLLISFSQRKTAKAILILSRAGRTVYRKSLFSFFFSDASYAQNDNVTIRSAAPYLFNEYGRFGGRTTSFRGHASENREDGQLDVVDADDNDITIDLGPLPDNPEGELLWVPRRTTMKSVWTDFIKLTFFAHKRNCRIVTQIRNQNELKSFSSIFFIKGRKPDMDKYLKFIESKDLFSIINDPGKHGIANLRSIVFSFGLTAEYNKVSKTIAENKGGAVELTTIKKIEDD